jgi:tRNA dimethylallyltransferase
LRQRPRHFALVGPTASGKSTLALALAEAVPGVEVVCVDAMQVYAGMDIGTAKPTAAERSTVPHHLLDLADPAERFTVTRFAEAARAALRGIEERGHIGLLVAGTGLYLQAVLGDIDPPGEWPDVRAALEAEADSHPGGPAAGTAALHARLAVCDPVAAGRMLPSNRRRVLRALEVMVGSGRRFSEHGPGIDAYPPTAVALTGIWLPRRVVAARIDRRVKEMLAAGWLAEVTELARRPRGLGRTARQALGYRELLAHIEQGADLSAMEREVVRRTRAFSLRQRRWFRRDPRIRWYGAAANPVAAFPALLRELQQCRPSS